MVDSDNSTSTQKSPQKQELDEREKAICDHYYINVKKMLSRTEKTELAKKHGMNPIAMNKWFQTRRNNDPAYETPRKSKNGRINKKKKMNTKAHNTTS